MKYLKLIDKFGDKFSFKYNGFDKYSTRIGGLVCGIIFLVSFGNFIIYFIPFVKKENYNLQFYSVNLDHTEPIDLNNSFIFGIDCGDKNKTKEAYDKYLELNIHFSEHDKEPIQAYDCNESYFGEELNETIKNLKINDLRINDFKCISDNNTDEIKGFYTDSNYSNFSYYKITISNKTNDFTKINEFLYENDCKLQFYYIDYSINVTNYTNPFKPLINSLFLQLNPDFYIKKNVF